MSIKVEQVKHWLTISGVSHAVAEVNSGWSYLACRKMITCDPDESTGLPKRICKKCREALKRCELLEPK